MGTVAVLRDLVPSHQLLHTSLPLTILQFTDCTCNASYACLLFVITLRSTRRSFVKMGDSSIQQKSRSFKGYIRSSVSRP